MRHAPAQSYPAKPIRFLVGFPPGGTNDILARALAPKLSEFLGQTVVIENRGGASTAIATELAARAAPDGYTIVLNAPGHATNPALMKLTFDPVRDFAFITLLAESQNLLVVHPSLPAQTGEIADRDLEAAPGRNQLRLVRHRHHAAPLRGAVPVHDRRQMGAHTLQGQRPGAHRAAGRRDFALFRQRARGHPARAGGQAAADRARAGTKRTPAAPGIPTVAESGLPGFAVTSWFGVAAPAKTPRPIVDRLHGEIVRALNIPDLRERMQGMGADPVGNTPEQYTAFVQNEIAKWGKVIKAAGIKGE